MVENMRFELITFRLQGGCSTKKELIPHNGGPSGTRTRDLCTASAAFSQLNYKPIIQDAIFKHNF